HHVSDPANTFHQLFGVNHLVSLQYHPLHVIEAERSHQQVVFPSFEPVARYNRHSAGCYRWRPLENRLFHPLLLRQFGEYGAVVVDTVGDNWPTIVQPRFNQVKLVTAHRSMFGLPYLSREGVDNRSLRIAMSVAVNGGDRSGSLHKRIVGRYSSIVMNPVDLAIRIVEPLRKIEMLSPFTHTEKEITLPVECELASPMVPLVGGR